MQIDQYAYRKSLSKKVSWKILLFISFIYIFFKIFSDSINSYWVDGVLKHFPTTSFSTALCLLTLLYATLKIKQALHHKLLPKLSSLVFVLALTTFYVGVVRNDLAYSFYAIDQLHLAWLKYADLFFISFCIVITEFTSYNKPLEKASHISLTADEPDPANINDLINSQSYVQRIAETINATACKMSFSIGVFSAWGSGKTDFLIRLKKVLETKPDENVVIDFNPWKAATTESVMDDFFTVLSNALRPFNRSIIPTIKTYSKKILAPGKEIQYRLLDTVTDEFSKDKSLEEKYNSINDSIRSTGKRFIIIIDDLDRMTGLEVMQVFRIIRNTASFDNTFFIVAIDHQYIVNVLEKTGLFSNEEQYLKKIFQLTITLPSIRKETFNEEIKRLLIYDNIPVADKDKILRAISFLQFSHFHFFRPDSPNNDHHLERMLDNYRDVKRFCNSIRINFEILKDDVEIIDLFLLELIKIKSFHLYEWIANKKLLQYTKQDNYTYTLNDDAWKLFKQQSHLDEFTLSSLQQALKYLVEKNDAKSIRQFTYPHNFYLYFTFQLFNLIPFRDFQKNIQLPWKETRAVFDVWVKEGKDRDLERILDSLTEFENQEQFEKFVKVFLGESDSNFASRATKLLKEWQRTIPKYFANQEAVAAFVIRILNDDELGEYNRAIVANEFLRAYIYENDEEKLIPKNTCQEIIYQLFDKFISREPLYTHHIFSFYLLNDDSRDENKYIKLYPPANKKLRKLLLDANNFEMFLKYTIRSYTQPNDGRFTLEPFTIQIFGDWNQFIEQATKHHSQDDDIKELLPFILEAAHELSKGSQWFSLDGEKKKQIINYLRKNGQYNFGE